MQKTSLDGQVKAQVVDHVPKRFKELQFGIQYEGNAVLPEWLCQNLRNLRSNQDIINQAVIECSDRMLYDVENNRRPVKNGVLDPRLVGNSDQPERKIDLIDHLGKIRKIRNSLRNLWGVFDSV